MKLLLDTIRLAGRSLERNPLRSALTSLGVIVGVAAVIAMVSLGQGARAALQAQIASAGTNLVMVFPGASTTAGARSGWAENVVSLTAGDAEAIARQVPGLLAVSWFKRGVAQVQAGGQNWSTTIWGVPPSYTRVRDWPVVSGDFISESQDDTAAKVAVLGTTVAEMLFGPGVDPVGAEIRIKDVPFRVIGVLESKGQNTYGRDQDDSVFIPFSTAERKVVGTPQIGSVDQILVSVASPNDEARVIEEVTALLHQRHRIGEGDEDDFAIRTLAELARTADSMARVMTNLLLAIASISLVVGGIGIMNILLVSVTERTREIGIRMAVGAKRRHILAQFLCEAVALSAFGGLVGIALGIGVSHAISRLSEWPTLISPPAVAGSFLFSAAVGVFFGFYPARRASRLNPIEALRYD
ncbi:MAG TPA: ABC transporter permease [Candidatus Binatia bacterium]|nr:ABC transporter permease [Candidatus Binatia bacterium]